MTGSTNYLVIVLILAWFPCSRSGRLTKCWTVFSGECIHKAEKCPFVNGKDFGEMNDDATNFEMCPLKDRRCCIPPVANATEKRHDNQCGISIYQEKHSSRIIGGEPSKPGEWPWHVLVRKAKESHCGGTLIHPRWVLSAAHCFLGRIHYSDWDVVISEINVNRVEGVEQTKKVKRIINHITFDYATAANDISLLELESDVKLSDVANTACLPNVNEQFNDMICTATGFGRYNMANIDSSPILRQVNKPVVSNSLCKVQMGPDSKIFEEQICAGFNEGGRDTCNGDSGGPLVCRKKDPTHRNRWILAGVVSYGHDCALREKSGVYTRVSKYLDWIEYHTRQPFFDGSYVKHPNKKFIPGRVHPS